MTEKDLFIGMKLYREVTHRSFPTEIKEYTVKKIARKYFYLNEIDNEINIETFKYQDKVYSQSSFQLYRTKEEIEDRHERDRLWSMLYKHFSGYNRSVNTVEQLRKVCNILEIGEIVR